MAKKKITLETLAAQMEKGFASADRKFEALADDISKLATKDQVIALQAQVNSIERQLRDTKTETRLADLEEKVFGAVRA
jgi:hypothetical protein